MNPISLMQTVAPSCEPLTLAEAKDQLLLTDANCSDADVRRLAALIALARTYVEDTTGLQLITATWAQKLDRFPAEDYILLRKPPLLTISSIAYLDAAGASQTLSAASIYQADASTFPGRVLLRPGQSWPETCDCYNAVTITYTAGYGATGASLPEPIRQALLLLVAHWYENRLPVSGSDAGLVARDLPLMLPALLASYRDWHHCL